MQNKPGGQEITPATMLKLYIYYAQGTTQGALHYYHQKQDGDALSRDTDHANDSISPIFDKVKEQNRLKQAQLIGEIGGQVMDGKIDCA